jgi:hypothetical protein
VAWLYALIVIVLIGLSALDSTMKVGKVTWLPTSGIAVVLGFCFGLYVR